jgi:hypothetical protein
VQVRTLKSDAVGKTQLVELLVDLSGRTAYADTDGITFTGASIIAAILGSRRNAETVRITYLGTYDLCPACPSQDAVGLTDGYNYKLAVTSYNGTTLTCHIVKTAVTESLLATGTGTLQQFNRPFGIAIAIENVSAIPTS